jgi:3-hydroxyisobutyrate dehydrogenase
MSNHDLISVGLAGLGNMGLPIAKRLIEADIEVYGFDLDEQKKALFYEQGGLPVHSILELKSKTNIVILLLPNSTIVGNVLFGEDGLIDSQNKSFNPAYVIDMSSSHPSDTKKYANQARESGVILIDAPVSGGVKKAITGELTIMAGGNQDAYKTLHERIFKHIGQNIYYLGEAGAGHAVKALNNYLSATHLYATIEAMTTLERLGIDQGTALNAINNSTGRSGSSEFKLPTFILNETYNSGFALGLLSKDVNISKDLIHELFGEENLATKIASYYEKASESLGKEADHTEMNRWVKEQVYSDTL